ncbi:Immunity protein 26 [Chishuiella changwenlii]|uniref:Immunity protein 26 n=1 Tax=Chishuiella changwenlii TaxID=1434701 RepID=A0A1M7D9S4_9FLAO|nr:Imm26 family immunity protein [Chishuiella changwenlii]GGF11539.1 hypothetical protein GCM10010984_30710 [Chishuiella changwenlii]SHL75939.1 Immunity protein 26 [Chishuiella changwenlii]
MKKQRITKGSILEIPIDGKYYVYAQILEKSSYVFFNFTSKEQITDFEILNEKPILFIIAVYNHVITKGEWLKVGKMSIRKELEVLPMHFIQDALNPTHFELYNPNTGEIVPTTKKEIIGLERASVWDKIHIEDRIRDFYNKVPCIWLEEDRELFNREFP